MPASIKPNPRLLRLAVIWLPLFIWMGVIFFFSSVPGENIPSLFPLQDVLFHAIIYAVLGYLFARMLKNTSSGIPSLKIFVFTALFTCGYGLSDEFHQLFVPGRVFSLLDLLTDVAGGIAGSLFYR